MINSDSADKVEENGVYVDYMHCTKRELDEINAFHAEIQRMTKLGEYAYETYRHQAQQPTVDLSRVDQQQLHVINMANYNYLGYSFDPRVRQAAKMAIDHYGVGACCSPIIGGQMLLHQQLELALLDFFQLPNHGVSLFSSGYATNVGTIAAIMKPSTHIILDQYCHMSLIEGAQTARAKIYWFKHNDMQDLECVLQRLQDSNKRVLICSEGVFSAEGDKAPVAEIVRLAKQYHALTLIDEAHSALLCGEHGRGVCAEQNVLQDVDFLVLTFSKSFAAIGGAVIAKKTITQYINFFARSRMFSCALDPAVTGAIIKVLELSQQPDGDQRRARLQHNIDSMYQCLAKHVAMLPHKTWVIPIIFGDERISFSLHSYLQQHGLDVGMLTYPAVPRGQARIRLFITAEHTEQHLHAASQIIINAAHHYGFQL